MLIWYLNLVVFLVFIIFLFMYNSPIYFFLKPVINSKNKNSKLWDLEIYLIISNTCIIILNKIQFLEIPDFE